jgi:hypothetical protein
MGTNYYLEEDVCECCNRPAQTFHIGKNSYGWVFALHVIPEEELHCLKDWIVRMENPKNVIKDEYGQTLSLNELINIIHSSGDERTPIDNHHCIGYDGDSCDLILGNFS